MSRPQKLGDLQHAILRVLWKEGEATIARVQEILSLEDRERALTTIATMLTKMERRSLVRRRLDGRHYVYAPSVSESAVTRSMVTDLKDRLFEGNASSLVAHLVTEEEFDPGELGRLKRLILERERDTRSPSDGSPSNEESGNESADGAEGRT